MILVKIEDLLERERESRKFRHVYNNIISIDNLLASWWEFLKGKRKRKDVAEFSLHLMDNIIALHEELSVKTYRHGGYEAFKINDPKPREIHKALVRDRLVHHAIYRNLYPLFDKKFICDSYSCRNNKGTHKALGRFRCFAYKVSQNNTRTCWVLQCDIRKFFANIDHKILANILSRHIEDKDVLWLLERVIDSFESLGKSDVGLPLGNLTSQLLVNIYMNEFDWFVKHELKVKWYIRYADDFAILHENKKYLEVLIPQIDKYLQSKLHLQLHPNKVKIKTLASGIDFLGWVNFADHKVLRTKTRNRMFARLSINDSRATLNSYLGLLSHGNTKKIINDIMSNSANH